MKTEGFRTPNKESIGGACVWIMHVLDGEGHDKGLKLNSAVTIPELNRNVINTDLDKYTRGSYSSRPLATFSLLICPTTLGTWTHICCILCAFYISSLCSECSFLPSLMTSMCWPNSEAPFSVLFSIAPLQGQLMIVIVDCPVFVEMPVFCSRLWVSSGQEWDHLLTVSCQDSACGWHLGLVALLTEWMGKHLPDVGKIQI